MTENYYPRLCGGTFLCLLLQFRRPRTAVRGSYYGMSDGMSEPDMLLDLIRVACPSYKAPHTSTLRNNTSRYKSCRLSANAYLPFDDPCFVDSFDCEIREDYSQPEKRMKAFFDKYFDPLPEDRTSRMVASLIDLVSQDESIDLLERLFVRSGGLVYAKHELLTAYEIELEQLLLGLWHFIITQRPNNSVGMDTYERWFAPPAQPGAKRRFISDIGQRRAEYEKQCRLNAERANPSAPIPACDAECQRQRTGYDYTEYLKRAAEKFGEMKTLLYADAPRPFYDIYVCSDVSKYEYKLWLDSSSEDETLHNPTVTELMKMYGRHIILYGTGGIGKSMMMRHLLLDAIKDYDQIGRVPFFIPLKDYDGAHDTLMDYIHDKITGLCRMTESELAASIQCGEGIILLDGLDEIKSQYIPDFERKLDEFTDRFPNCVIIISSRPSRNFVSYHRFVIVEVMPFSKEQSLALIDKLEFRPDAPEIKQKFRERLDTTYYETHEEFASTPLLLTIMLMTFEQYAEVPGRMTLFYREAFYTMAQRHDASKGAYRRELKTGLSPDQFSDYFAEFCARTYYAEKIHFTWYEFEYYFNSLNIVYRQQKDDVTARDFLDDLTNSLCLIYLDGNHYTFTHRSFQEYFCALYFSKQKDRTLGSIGSLFEKSPFMAQGYVFDMLYDLIPEKVEEYILRPALEKLFDKCEQEEGYWTYLMIEHPKIIYASSNNPTILFSSNSPEGFFVQFLADELLDEDIDMISGHPKTDDFAFRCLGDDIRYQQDGINCTVDQILDSEADGSGPAFHFSLHLDIQEAWEHRDKHGTLFDALASDDFPLKIEYDTLLDYYRRISESPTPSTDNFFDQF